MIEDSLKKNNKELQSALIKPLWKEYPFSTNGVYFFIGKMGSGKSYEIWKHIMMTEQLNGKPFTLLLSTVAQVEGWIRLLKQCYQMFILA